MTPIASAQIQKFSLSFDETAQLGDLVFGPGIAEVTTSSTGATTAGGTVNWVVYFEQPDDLGMYHVYYRQQYLHPQLGQLRVAGTSAALHFAEDGSLRWARGAQVNDVAPLPEVTVPNAEQAFAAVQAALADWPGFVVGNPATWPAGTLASLLQDSELLLANAVQSGPLRPLWRVPTFDGGRRRWSVLLDAATGSILSTIAGNPSYGPQTDCSPDNPGAAPAHSVPELIDHMGDHCGQPGYGCDGDGYRTVWAHDCPACLYEYGNPCGNGISCTHEGAAVPPGVPQIEVYHGMPAMTAYLHCGTPDPEGQYMRVGLKVSGSYPLYDEYRGGKSQQWAPSINYRRWAGDAMFYTKRTMDVFLELGRDSFDNNGHEARVVVDAYYTGFPTDGSGFMYEGSWDAPLDGVFIYPPSDGRHSMSSALDIVAHEWGHGVSKYSPVNFFGNCRECWSTTCPDTCEMSEGFADVVGHIVERKVQTNQAGGEWAPEQWDWIAGEEFDPSDSLHRLRHADAWDVHTCAVNGIHESVHAEDEGCEPLRQTDPQVPSHSNGNRISVALKLMTDGGVNPAYGHISPCTGCDIDVPPIDPQDSDNSFETAMQILWRVLTLQADESTTSWEDLPQLALEATFDLYLNADPCDTCAIGIQDSVQKAFAAVGYPQGEIIWPQWTCAFCGK